MNARNLTLIFCLLAVCSAVFQGQDDPVLTGYVTRAASGSDFDVNGIRILCSGVNRGAIVTASGIRQSAAGCQGSAPYIGERLAVYSAQSSIQFEGGPNTERVDSINATRIEYQPMRHYEISSSAVIDVIPGQPLGSAPAADFLVRADGYRIRITGKTKIEWKPPLRSLADVKAGDWIKYKGKLDAAGVLVAASVEIGPNTISNGEDKLRKKGEYDPSAVTPGTKQNFLEAGFKGGCGGSYIEGCDPKKFPPFDNAEMQARIEKIGDSLIPAYQRALPADDPARIDFRFQLIDTKLLRSTFTLSSGIILVPHQVVERLQNDSQLAAVLADGIARALEKQQYRTEGKIRAADASTFAAAFVPYAGLGAFTGFEVASDIEEKVMEQRDRVSLVLLHDAGYDIDQAPIAWWLLDPGKPAPLAKIDIPDRAVYLYRILGESWHNPAASTAQTH
jgi:hypothetical protein